MGARVRRGKGRLYTAPGGALAPPPPWGVPLSGARREAPRHGRRVPGAGPGGCDAVAVNHRTCLPAAVLAAAVLLPGCAQQQADTASSSSSASSSESAPSSSASASSTSSASPSSAPAEGPAFPADTDPDTAEASADARVTVTDIRTGRHDGFDRVVLEVEGAGTPGWDVRYVDAASSQGSGEPVEVDGDAVLQVTVTGAGYPYDTGAEEYAGADPLPGEGTQTVTEVAFDATYEGTTVAFIGTSSRAPFRVYLLEDPSRLVVEVADQA